MPTENTYERTEAGPGPESRLPNEPYYRRQAPERRNGPRALGIVLVLLGLLWLMGMVGLPALGWNPSTVTLVDQTLPGSRLELTAISGDVEIVPWDRREIRVEVTQRGGQADRTAVEVQQAGDAVRVTTSQRSDFCIGFCWRELRYRVSLPEGAAASVRTASGDIDVAGAGDLTIETVSGDVELRDIRGRLEGETTSGDVRLDNGALTGARLQTVSGDVRLSGVDGAIAVATTSGDITVQDAARGTLALGTTSGGVEYEGGLAPGESRVSTISGDVELRLPADGGFRLDASTVSGEISNDFALEGLQQDRRALRGTAGDGAATLSVQTTSGDISIRER